MHWAATFSGDSAGRPTWPPGANSVALRFGRKSTRRAAADLMSTMLKAREPSPRFVAIGRVLVDRGPLIALFNVADRAGKPLVNLLRA